MTQSESQGDNLVCSYSRELVREALREMHLGEEELKVSPGSVKGDNYLGVIARVEATGTDKEGNKQSVDLIVKSAPTSEKFRSFAPVRPAYEREVLFYTKIIPAFRQFQEEKEVQPLDCFAPCYAASLEVGKEALVLKNMKPLGYSLKDRRQVVDFAHAKLFYQQLGRLHALSFAVRDQRPAVFERICEDNSNYFFKWTLNKPELLKTMMHQAQRALTTLDAEEHAEVRQRFANALPTLCEDTRDIATAEAAGQYGVVAHGDSWCNNILYKYEDDSEPNVPTKLCLLDWQLSYVGHPAMDISYYLYACTDKRFRDEHFEDVLRVYHDSLSTFLREMGSDPEKLFPYESLRRDFPKFAKFGLAMGCMLIHLNTSNPDEAPDLVQLLESQASVSDALKYDSANYEIYKQRMRDVILHAASVGTI